MNTNPIEIYHPRTVTDCGIWDIGHVKFKIYGLLARGKKITSDMTSLAQQFIFEETSQRIESMSDNNGLGFVIIHPGDLGMSISTHWWVQGSVLCQHIYRRQYADSAPLDTSTRPAIACIWELALINAEQESWRATMMKPEPDHMAYLMLRTPITEA